MSNQSINVGFKVQGGDLSSYVDTISRKSQQQNSESIKSAIAQTDKAKEQLAIINQINAANERRSRIETQAGRSLILEKRETDLGKNRDFYEGKRNDVFADRKMSEADKKEKINALTGSEKEGEQKIKGDYRDNLTLLKEQDRQQRLQNQLSREQIDTVKTTARENVKAISNGDLKLSEVIKNASTDEEKLVAKLTQEGVKAEKKQTDKEKGGGVLDAVLKGELIRSTGNMIGGIPQAKNELDFVKPLASLLGMAIGGALGTAADLADVHVFGTGLGQTSAGVIGVEMGKVAGDFIGGSLERAYKGREELTNKTFALQALTGTNYNVDALGGANGLGGTGRSNITGNLSKYGYDYSSTSDLQFALAQKQGTAKNLGGGAENVIGLEKGLGVSRESIFSIIELQRSASKENRDFLKTISGVLNAGKNGIFKEDRTLLSEFLGKYAQITKELLKGQSTVGSATGFNLLDKFNNVGKEWSVSDPRSAGLISTVNNSLTNPNTDFKKALAFYTIKKRNPNMSTADMIEEEQKGIGSEYYFNDSMDQIDHMGGSDSDKRLQFAGRFGLEGQQKFASDLYRGYKSGKLDRKTLQGMLPDGMGEGAIRGMAEDQTGKYTKSTSEISNMFVDDVATAVSGVGDKMKVLFGSMIGELETFIVAKIKGTDDKTHIPKTPTKHSPYSSKGNFYP